MRLLALIATLALWANSLQAQVVPIRATYQVCIDNQSCRQEMTAGSAVNIGRIDGKWLFVSAGHLFHGNNVDARYGIKVLEASVDIDNEPHTATLLRYFLDFNNALDLSFWAVECNRHDCHPYSLLDKYPSRGTGMQVIGFSAQGGKKPRPTTFNGLVSNWISTSHDTAEGDSGGALLYQGAVAGIVSGGGIGSDITPGRYTSSLQVIKYVKKWFPQAEVTIHEPPPPRTTEPPVRWEPVQPGANPGGDSKPAQSEPADTGPIQVTPAPQDAAPEAPEPQPSPGPIESLINSPLTTAIVGATTGGTGAAAIWGLRALLALRRRRKDQKNKQGGNHQPPAMFPGPLPGAGTTGSEQPTQQPALPGATPCPELPNRNLDEARQLTQLGQLEGRNPLLDSVGFVHFEDLRQQAPEEDRAVLDRYWYRIKDHIEQVAPISYRTKVDQ